VLALPEEREVALVFGREVSGLTNDELLRCHYHVHIAVNPDYTSLNLAAAVMVLSYELRKTALALTEPEIEHKAAVPQPGQVGWGQQPATADELEHYLNHLEKILIQLDFLKCYQLIGQQPCVGLNHFLQPRFQLVSDL
jgi:TrmH family RNA methyltransferase